MTEKTRGFTLIELSIVLIILGILMASLLPIYQNYLISYKGKKLDSTMATIRTALADFIIDDEMNANDPDEVRYPCPAPVDAPVTSPQYGTEQCTVGPVGSCNNGVCVRAGTGGRPVLVGTVPTRTLGIAGTYMSDPYGNRLTYAVSADLIAPHAMQALTSSGAITIVDEGGPITSNGQFALVSHGLDGAGSYTSSGAKNGKGCRAGTGPGDSENCNDDATFRVAVGETNVETNAYYDDKAAFTLVKDDDDQWWRQTNASGQSIVNRNPQNVGIGFTAGDPSQKLDVNGNIRSRENILSDKDINATNNFHGKSYYYTGGSPIAAGANVNDVVTSGVGDVMCPEGQVLRGIVSGAPVCVNYVATSSSGNPTHDNGNSGGGGTGGAGSGGSEGPN